MIRSWKERNTLKEAENSKARGRILDQEHYKGKFSQMPTSNMIETLENNLEEVTAQLEKLEAERKEAFGRVEGTSSHNNKKHPGYESSRLRRELANIVQTYAHGDSDLYDKYSSLLRKVSNSLLGTYKGYENKEPAVYNKGYKDSALYTFADDWIEPAEEILDLGGYSEEEKEEFIQRGLDAQEKEYRETPILAEYNEEIYALQQIKKNFEDSIALLKRL